MSDSRIYFSLYQEILQNSLGWFLVFSILKPDQFLIILSFFFLGYRNIEFKIFYTLNLIEHILFSSPECFIFAAFLIFFHLFYFLPKHFFLLKLTFSCRYCGWFDIAWVIYTLLFESEVVSIEIVR
jgi:hypothetical protein